MGSSSVVSAHAPCTTHAVSMSPGQLQNVCRHYKARKTTGGELSAPRGASTATLYAQHNPKLPHPYRPYLKLPSNTHMQALQMRGAAAVAALEACAERAGKLKVFRMGTIPT